MKLIMDDGQEFKIESVRMADIGPGDIIVMEIESHIADPVIYERLRDSMKRFFPNNKIMVIEDGMELSIVRKVQAPSSTKQEICPDCFGSGGPQGLRSAACITNCLRCSGTGRI